MIIRVIYVIVLVLCFWNKPIYSSQCIEVFNLLTKTGEEINLRRFDHILLKIPNYTIPFNAVFLGKSTFPNVNYFFYDLNYFNNDMINTIYVAPEFSIEVSHDKYFKKPEENFAAKELNADNLFEFPPKSDEKLIVGMLKGLFLKTFRKIAPESLGAFKDTLVLNQVSKEMWEIIFKVLDIEVKSDLIKKEIDDEMLISKKIIMNPKQRDIRQRDIRSEFLQELGVSFTDLATPEELGRHLQKQIPAIIRVKVWKGGSFSQRRRIYHPETGAWFEGRLIAAPEVSIKGGFEHLVLGVGLINIKGPANIKKQIVVIMDTVSRDFHFWQLDSLRDASIMLIGQ